MKPGELLKKKHNAHRPDRGNRQDMEFLPAALEILETPTSPIRVAFIWFICLLTALVLLWSWFGKFDIVATAQGKIQPAGRVKTIQSLESGKTKGISVRNGDFVKAGDVIVELDDTEIVADVTAKLARVHALTAEISRRNSFVTALEAWKRRDIWAESDVEVISHFKLPSNIPPALQKREQVVFEADMRGLLASLDSLAAQRNQRHSEIEGLNLAVVAQKNLVETLDERVAMRTKLAESSVSSRAQVIDAMQAQQEAAASLADKLAQLRAAEAAFKVATSEGIKLIETAIADNASRKLEAERNIDEMEQELIKADSRRKLMTIRSPISGTVQLSSLTAAGQVIASGTELMRIVPDDVQMEIEAFLPNKDIGFVEADQPAIIKVEAYPFTRYGILEGRVVRVSSDAIPEPDAQQMESTIAQNARSTMPTGNVPRVQNLVFPITIGLERASLSVEGRTMPVSPGMGVTVEIKTGQRRILEYLFSPLAQIASEAMGER